jgi:actin-related protein
MSGHGVTEVAPVFEGYGVKNAFKRYNWGGVDVTRWLGTELHTADAALDTSTDELILWNIKEQMSCAPIWASSMSTLLRAVQSLATESEKLQLREQVVEVAEIIFDPKRAGHDIPGLAQMTWNAIQNCPTDSKKSFMDSVLLFGGNTMVKGLKERMSEEMNAFSAARGGEDCKVIAQPERMNSSWAGASILACLPEFSGAEDATKAMWIGKAEFDEMGGDRVVQMSSC